MNWKGEIVMFNLIKDEFDENSDDILNAINKMIEESQQNKDENKNKE